MKYAVCLFVHVLRQRMSSLRPVHSTTRACVVQLSAAPERTIVCSERMSTRSKVLSLYRTILRTGRAWKGPQEERDYIGQEAKSHFRQNKHLTSPGEIEAKLKEAQDRLEVAEHYQIPYPRMYHKPQFKKRDFEIPIIK